jgi:hypothetical protein
VADARPSNAALIPAGAAPPGASRPTDAKRVRVQPGGFGLAIFKQFEKLGF